MKILVTGGAGFIGSHLVDLLVELGHEVVVLDNLSSGRRHNLNSGCSLFDGDIRSSNDCENAVDGCDAVFHLAAMSRSGPSMSMIDECHQINVVGTLNMLRASEKKGVKKFIYSASSTCYGNSPPPHTIDSKIELLNPYGWSKFTGEQLALTVGKTSKIEVVSLRFFNVYGPREPVAGEYALVIGTFINRLANNEVLEIHGDGLQSRDFVHVSDVVACLVQALLLGVNGLVLNVGSGVGTTIKEIADLISPFQSFTHRRLGDAMHTLADISLTKKVLGWSPKVSIEYGIKMAIIESATRSSTD